MVTVPGDSCYIRACENAGPGDVQSNTNTLIINSILEILAKNRKIVITADKYIAIYKYNIHVIYMYHDNMITCQICDIYVS